MLCSATAVDDCVVLPITHQLVSLYQLLLVALSWLVTATCFVASPIECFKLRSLSGEACLAVNSAWLVSASFGSGARYISTPTLLRSALHI